MANGLQDLSEFPNKVDTFEQMSDLDASTMGMAQTYKDYINNGDYVEAEKYLNGAGSALKKCGIKANLINKIIGAIQSIQATVLNMFTKVENNIDERFQNFPVASNLNNGLMSKDDMQRIDSLENDVEGLSTNLSNGLNDVSNSLNGVSSSFNNRFGGYYPEKYNFGIFESSESNEIKIQKVGKLVDSRFPNVTNKNIYRMGVQVKNYNNLYIMQNYDKHITSYWVNFYDNVNNKLVIFNSKLIAFSDSSDATTYSMPLIRYCKTAEIDKCQYQLDFYSQTCEVDKIILDPNYKFFVYLEYFFA